MEVTVISLEFIIILVEEDNKYILWYYCLYKPILIHCTEQLICSWIDIYGNN